MRILLDESVPVQEGKAFAQHDVYTVRQMGWGGYSNGDLLAAADREHFQVLVIADKNLRYQQNTSNFRFAILELWTNHRPTLERHLDKIRLAVETITPTGYFLLENPNPGEN